jgi:hypothetical protein
MMWFHELVVLDDGVMCWCGLKGFYIEYEYLYDLVQVD